MAYGNSADAVRATPIETSLGIVLLLAGGVLTFAPEAQAYIRVTGYIVSTAGTLLFSWALTRAWVAFQREHELVRSLKAIASPLSTVASQLNQAVLQQNQGVDPEVVSLSVQHLYGVLSHLQEVMGSPLSVDEVVVIKTRLEMLGRELAAAESEPADAGETGVDQDGKTLIRRIADEINSLRLQFQSAVPRKDRQYKSEMVQCPTCRHPVAAVLGSLAGDSAIPTCASCGTRFHAHRAGDGSVFTRPWGAANPSVSLRVACGNCGNDVPLTVPRESTAHQYRFCLSCFTKLQIQPTSQEVIVLRGPEEPITGTLSLDRATIMCPQCGQQRRSIFNRDAFYFAVCTGDDRLLRARIAEVHAAAAS